MDILRNDYVAKIAAKSWNGKVKIITGIRRCGKSYLLSHLYKQYLLQQGVSEDCFVEIDVEKDINSAYRNPNTLCDYVMGQCAALDGRRRNNIHGRDTIFATTRDIVLGNT